MRSAYAWDDRECVHIGSPVRKNTLTWDLEVSIYILCRGQIQMETVHTVQLIPPPPRSNVPDVVTPAKMAKEIPNLKRKRPTSNADRPRASQGEGYSGLGARCVAVCCNAKKSFLLYNV